MQFCWVYLKNALFVGLLLVAPVIVAARDVSVRFKVFPQNFECSDSSGIIKPRERSAEWRTYVLPDHRSFYTLSAPGYQPYFLALNPKTTKELEIKLERVDSRMKLIGEFPTGAQPKSVAFTPDGNHALVAQLSGNGVDLYQTQPFRWLRQIDIPPRGRQNQNGYVEIAMLPWQDEIWVTQMTTGMVHVIGLSDFSWRSAFSVGGEWPKVITVHPDHKMAFVSNWLSEDVSVVDSVHHSVLKRIHCTGTPRGMAVSPDKKSLWVAIFGTGAVDKIRLSDLTRVKTLKWPGIGAKRHIVLNPDGTTMYVSDMELGEIWAIDLEHESLKKRIPVGPKLNSFDVSPDGRYLFVSSRGTNNSETYLEKGPDFGTMSVVDTAKLVKIDWVWGRNQPTGLAVSPDGTMVAFTDFLDNNLELYDIRKLTQ